MLVSFAQSMLPAPAPAVDVEEASERVLRPHSPPKNEACGFEPGLSAEELGVETPGAVAALA